MKNRLLLLILGITGILLISFLVSCKKSDPDPVPVNNEVKLGAILDLSGIYSEEGMAGKVAMETGVADLNQLYLLAGSATRFSVTVRDAGMDTAKALTAAKEMYNQGIRLLVGGPNTKKTAVTLDAEAAAFAHEVRFLAPIMAIGTASSVPPNAAEIAGRIRYRKRPEGSSDVIDFQMQGTNHETGAHFNTDVCGMAVLLCPGSDRKGDCKEGR